MIYFRNTLRWLAAPMAVMVLCLSITTAPATAAMVDTQAAVERDAAADARAKLKSLLARDDVRKELLARGIDPEEARKRVNALTDSEAVQVAGQIDQLPAGGSFIGVLVGIAVIVFIVLVITDYTGQTNVFPFIKAH